MLCAIRSTGIAVLFCLTTGFAQTIHGRGGITLPAPPDAQVTPVTDNYFGTKVVDNYRWLENAQQPGDQGVYRRRERLHGALHEAGAHPLADCRRSGSTGARDEMDACRSRAATILFFEKMLAGEDQASIYVRHGWAEKEKRLIDPAQFSRDPNTSVNLADVSRDGTLVAYLVREGGADETTVRVYNVKTKKTLEDELSSAIYYRCALLRTDTGCSTRAWMQSDHCCTNTSGASAIPTMLFFLVTSFAAKSWGRAI